MCRLRNIALRDLPRKCDYRTDTHTHRQTGGQSDPYEPLCFTGDTKTIMWSYKFPPSFWISYQSLYTYYSGWMSCLFSFIWALSSCEEQETCEKFKMKIYVSIRNRTKDPSLCKMAPYNNVSFTILLCSIILWLILYFPKIRKEITMDCHVYLKIYLPFWGRTFWLETGIYKGSGGAWGLPLYPKPCRSLPDQTPGHLWMLGVNTIIKDTVLLFLDNFHM